MHYALICSTGNRAGTCTTVSEYVGDGEARGVRRGGREGNGGQGKQMQKSEAGSQREESGEKQTDVVGG